MRKKYPRLTWDMATGLIAEHSQEIASDNVVSDPIVTVSVVTYNHADYIAQALDSVLEQETSFPFEILIGEDGSTDGTREIVQTYQKAHPHKIRLFQSTKRLGEYTGNGRLNLVRNLNAARGEFIALLEGDDYWCDPHKLELQTKFLMSNPGYTGSFHDTDLLDGGTQVPWREFGEQLEFSQKDFITTRSPFHTSSFVFKRSACQMLPKSQFMLTVQSFDMAWFTCVSATGPLRRIPRTMSAYRKHEGGITARLSMKGTSLQLERYAMWKNIKPVIDPVNTQEYRRTVEHHGDAAAKRITTLAELRFAHRVLCRTLPVTAVGAFDLFIVWRRFKSACSRLRKPYAVLKSCLQRLRA